MAIGLTTNAGITINRWQLKSHLNLEWKNTLSEELQLRMF